MALAETPQSSKHDTGIQKSYQIDITKDWLETDDWDIPHFEIPSIEEGVTIIDLSSLRKSLQKPTLSS